MNGDFTRNYPYARRPFSRRRSITMGRALRRARDLFKRSQQ